MSVDQLGRAALPNQLANELGMIKRIGRASFLRHSGRVCNFFVKVQGKRLSYAHVGSCSLSIRNVTLLSSPIIRRRTVIFSRSSNQSGYDCSARTSELEESYALGEDDYSNSMENAFELIEIMPSGIAVKSRNDFVGIPSSQDVKHELVMLSLPAIAGQALEPLAQLMETAYVGRLGPVELASTGVSMSIFNYVSKLFNIPLLNVATSFVAEDISKNASRASLSEDGYQGGCSNGKPFNDTAKRQQLSSVSTALLLAVGIGIFEALALSLGSGFFLNIMGVSPDSLMHSPAQQFLILRAIGAPAVVVSLALQGVFRGFKDTRTPVLCLGIGNLSAILLLPLLVYYLQLGVIGAAISTVVSQYIVTFLMIWYLNKRVVLLPPRLGALQFGGYVKSGGFLLGRTLSVLVVMTLATKMAAHQGPLAMAAHQICLQVWLAVSLLTDALATSGQALIAGYLSKGDYRTVREITHFLVKIGLVAGFSLAAVLGVSFGPLASLFTNDVEVLGILRTGVLFVTLSQPVTALAFIFDGLHYGVSDFQYAAHSMMLVAAMSTIFLLYAPSIFGLLGVWLGLTLFMSLRMVAGFVRLLSKVGPWWFLHSSLNKTELAA